MGDYSFLADVLNKCHTSPPWIQFFWVVSIPAFLFGLGWCIKEIFVAFAQRAKPEGELVYTIYRTDEDKFVVYSHAPYEQIDSNNLLNLLIGGKAKLSKWKKPKQSTESDNKDGRSI